MSRRNKALPLLERVTITGVAAEGKALARVNDMVVFVPYVAPGDVVDLQVTRKKHSYAEAIAVRFYEYSSERTQPFCPHFGTCGGCKWQHIAYQHQVEHKRQQVVDALTRIGHIQLPEVKPTLGSELTREYRNKVEFGFSPRVWLTPEQIKSGAPVDKRGGVGFHPGGAFDKILPIEECHLMAPINNQLRLSIRDYALEHGLSFYDQREHCGLLRDMMIRLSNSGELMLVLQFCLAANCEEPNPETPLPCDPLLYGQAMGLLQHIADHFPQVTSLLWVDNRKWNDTFGDLPVHTFKGTDFIYLFMDELRFKVGPKSFYQTNTTQALRLYQVARNMAGLTGSELVYDLYTGTGTIANFVARQARQVIGIEYVPEAIEDARVNSDLNGISNTLFFAGDMKDILNREFVEQYGRPDVIITDPPRAGMHPDVVNTILFAAPLRIVYVSCNPATQARDLQLLDADYRVVAVQPVDMFPHTHHVENVVLLEKRVS